MFEAFRTKAEGVGAEVCRCATKADAFGHLQQLLRDAGVASRPGAWAAWAASPVLAGEDTAPLAAAVPGLRFDVTRQVAAETLVGISQMEWGLADTGSLVADQSAVDQRLVSTLPAIHVALIATSSILPDKQALFARINPATSRFIAFITGPSRTADIERVLTIGVHGPKRLIIICVDELGGTLS